MDQILNSPPANMFKMALPVIAVILFLKFLFSLIPVPGVSSVVAAI